MKSYLPTHSVFHKFAAQYLCSFADAIRTKRAEAKHPCQYRDIVDFDAIRTKCAEAKIWRPRGTVQEAEMQSARNAFPICYSLLCPVVGFNRRA